MSEDILFGCRSRNSQAFSRRRKCRSEGWLRVVRVSRTANPAFLQAPRPTALAPDKRHFVRAAVSKELRYQKL